MVIQIFYSAGVFRPKQFNKLLFRYFMFDWTQLQSRNTYIFPKIINVATYFETIKSKWLVCFVYVTKQCKLSKHGTHE